MAFHYFEGIGIGDVYNTIIGSIGVDVFVILSGFGIYHSLSRSFDLGRYYQRRAMRVLLPYAIAGLVFWLAKDLCVLGLTLSAFLKDYLFISFITDGVRTVWYVPFILGMYLCAPLVYKVMKRGCPATVLVVAWLLVCFWISAWAPNLFRRTEVALTRVPAFLLGMGCGKLAQRQENVPAWLFAVLLAIPLKFFTGTHGQIVARTINVLYAGALIVLMVLFYNVVGNEHLPSKLRELLDHAGSYSYELYLTHVLLRNLIGTLGMDLRNPLVYLACMAVAIPLAVLLAQAQHLPARRSDTMALS